ncbi:MliC family protein [Bryobacter aggregatus]|uniref:MliC family protein n=1 Tax=Bryobacter aggregatus TaxID=360054 RepID=UPI0004E209A3|nr:MliC family protein [Bryobacter aggregatus]
MNRKLALLFATACLSCEKPDSPAVLRYTCEGGYQFVVELKGSEAELTLGGQKHTLKLVEAATGAKFSDGVISYWSKGSSALLNVADISYKDCVASK